MSYFAIVIAFAQKYDKKVEIGTLISTILPYTIAFSIVWVIVLITWMLTGIPLGPNAPIYYNLKTLIKIKRIQLICGVYKDTTPFKLTTHKCHRWMQILI